MGLLDYYRQFEGLSEQEINLGKRRQADERRRHALARVQTLDLSQTTWPALPHPYVVNAVTFVARRGLHRYPSQGSAELRSELAHRHGLGAKRLVVGNGAAQLISAAIGALLEPGQELITAWPSYGLYPIAARRARGSAVPVAGGGVDDLLAAVTERSRVIALASPNDPTGELVMRAELERLLAAVPERVAVLLDEALVDFADAQPTDAAVELLEDHPRLIVFRSFSKAWGLAGLRCGYAMGGPGSEQLLDAIEPDLGINELAQAGVLESLRSGSSEVARRARAVGAERTMLRSALRARGLYVEPTQANFLWAAHPQLDGTQLADRLARAGVLVAAGAALGAPERVRISVRDSAARERLLSALDTVASGDLSQGR